MRLPRILSAAFRYLDVPMYLWQQSNLLSSVETNAIRICSSAEIKILSSIYATLNCADMAISIDKLYDDVCQKSWDLLGECKAPTGNASPAWHFFFQRVLLRLELWGDDLGWNNKAFDPAKVQSLNEDNLPLILSAIGEKLQICETQFRHKQEDLEKTE